MTAAPFLLGAVAMALLEPVPYPIRLFAFTLILVAIIDKNLRGRGDRR